MRITVSRYFPAPTGGPLVDNLRIADGLIMPRITTGNTMAPCVIIGERAAEILHAEHKLETSVIQQDKKVPSHPNRAIHSTRASDP